MIFKKKDYWAEKLRHQKNKYLLPKGLYRFNNKKENSLVGERKDGQDINMEMCWRLQTIINDSKKILFIFFMLGGCFFVWFFVCWSQLD